MQNLIPIQKFLFVFLLASLQLAAMQQTQLKLEHRKRKGHELYHPLPNSLRTKPIIQLTALNEQTDLFSCGYRTLFHARCIDIALEKALIQDKPIEQSLKELLPNTSMLNDIYAKVLSYLATYDTKHDKSRGLIMHHMLGICKVKLPTLKDNILPVMLEENGKICTLFDPRSPNPQMPLEYTLDFICKYGSAELPEDKCKIELDQSIKFKHQLKKLEMPLHASHFACRYPRHAFLASIVTDEKRKATLYVIDSTNNNLENVLPIYNIVSKLLTYVESHNNKNKKQKTTISVNAQQAQPVI